MLGLIKNRLTSKKRSLLDEGSGKASESDMILPVNMTVLPFGLLIPMTNYPKSSKRITCIRSLYMDYGILTLFCSKKLELQSKRYRNA